MSGIRATISALTIAACAAAFAGCGGGDEEGSIPRATGEELLAQLDQIEQQVETAECDSAQATAIEFATGVSDLPDEVDPALRDALVEAGARLEALVEEQCEPDEGATGPTGLEEEPDPVIPEEEDTTTTEETGEEPPDEERPGNQGGDQGGGQGNGNSTPPGQDDEPPDDSSGGIGSDG